ncbi:MAG TPA: AbrB/MazE/SpoVT family DNA-binding domain-containing protein [Nitrososphaerales archaeon]|nr:AbrB/MazE/SpoVT family DNA-binding domain-containing protein [Nitrososphaerales archaeon]
MPISKVNRNYQVTIPKEVRQRAKIGRGDSVLVEFDEEEEIVKLSPPKRGKRKTWRFGSRLTVERIEASIDRGQSSP